MTAVLEWQGRIGGRGMAIVGRLGQRWWSDEAARLNCPILDIYRISHYIILILFLGLHNGQEAHFLSVPWFFLVFVGSTSAIVVFLSDFMKINFV